ncbi:hypothetical protein ACTVBU_10810 [Sanguibacter sp. A246]|uniref:hypothetical protein n=1 Tax=Sanguibacter sp. A246 TaxID=3457326 RepID=UPI003FD8C532
MTARITEGEWGPLPGSLPDIVNSDTVYVIPTRPPAEGGDVPRYNDMVRDLPKIAREAGAPVEFATPNGTREFLAEYSVGPEMWALGLACLQIASDWIIHTVTLFISSRAKSQGWKQEEASQLPLRVTVAETSTGRNYAIEGSGAEVVEALKVLQQG